MGRLSAGDRLGRMLELVPWVMSQDGAEISEISRRFDYPKAELQEDLIKVLFMVGLYPFTPDQLINVMGLDVLEEDAETINPATDTGLHAYNSTTQQGWVAISNADYFSRPLRLTSAQALSLIGAAKALLTETDKDGPLTRGIDKLAAGLEISLSEDVEINLGDAPQEWLQPLQQAVQQQQKVQITYYSYGRRQENNRVIQPHRVFAEGGNLYVKAHCEAAGGVRVFLIGRIRDLQLLNERFEPPDEAAPPLAFQPRAEDPLVVINLTQQGSWVLEKYPVESHEQLSNNKIAVTLRVSEISFLETLLLQLGEHAELQSVEGNLAMQIPQQAAKRVLQRYQ